MSNTPAWYDATVPTLFCGHAGAGKTNLVLNLCEQLSMSSGEPQVDAKQDKANVIARSGRDKTIQDGGITLLDLDISNPYFRSSDYATFLTDHNVRLLGPVYGQNNTSLDTPSLMAGMSDVFNQTSYAVIIDVGGDADGSKSLGRLVPEIIKADYCMIYVANFNRLQTEHLTEHLDFIREIEQATGLTFNGIINNTHLGRETTLKDMQTSIPLAKQLAEQCEIELLASTVNTDYIEAEVTVGCGLPRRLSARADGSVLYSSSDISSDKLATEVPIWRIRTIVDLPW